MTSWVAGLETEHEEGACFQIYPEVQKDSGELALLSGSDLGRADLDFYGAARLLYRQLINLFAKHYEYFGYEGPEFFSATPLRFQKLSRTQRAKFLQKHFQARRTRFMRANQYRGHSRELRSLIGHRGLADMLEHCRLWFGSSGPDTERPDLQLPAMMNAEWPVHWKGWDGWFSIFCLPAEKERVQAILEEAARALGMGLLSREDYNRIRSTEQASGAAQFE